jgi:putative ABC transport system substrate-binding protein
MMRRREFVAGIGSAAAWPVVAVAQQSGPMRRIGVLIPGSESAETERLRVTAFQQGLAKLGWTDGRNITIDYRWVAGDGDRLPALAKELTDLKPDVLLAGAQPALAALQQATRSIPIVFAAVVDPIGSGFVASLARPGSNSTGFALSEPPMASKWVELLKGIAPGTAPAAFLFNPELAPFAGEYFRHAEAAAARLRVELTAAAAHDDRDIEDALAALARLPNGGLVVNPDTFNRIHRQQIIALTARHRLPAIYGYGYYVADGGLMSYGADPIDHFRQAASYVDRILRGEKPADLPVQAPTKFEMVINLKTAKALGLTIPDTLLATADEVIQ